MKKTILTIIILISLISLSYAQTGEYKAGDGAGFNRTTGDYNTLVGDSAGYSITTKHYNTFLGFRTGFNTLGAENTFVGYESGSSSSGLYEDCTFMGFRSGYYNERYDNTFLGHGAGFNNTQGDDNTFVGEGSGLRMTTGDDNTFIGCQAGAAYSTSISSTAITTGNPATGSDNTIVGSSAGYQLTSGYRNAFLGSEAGWDCTTGYRNTFIGDSAGIDVSDGHHNTFIGQASGSCTEYADYNTFVGSYAGWDNNRTNETNNANYNTYLGYGTGYTNREGQYNVLIGALTDFSSSASTGNGSTNSYNIGIGYDALINGERVYSGVIGANARVSTNNSFVIGGTTSVTRMSVGIGTDSPNQNASLELAEDDKGFLITRMSNTERTTFSSALGAADMGMMVYDTTSQHLNIWNGTNWGLSGVQSLDLSSNILTISDGNTVNLSPYLDNTDAQDLTLTGNTLELTNDGTTVDLSGYLDNTDSQDLTLTINTLALTNDGTSVDLTPYLDDTDTHLTEIEVDAMADNNGYLTSFTEVDGDITNEIQDLQLVGNDLTITNNGTATTIDLSAYLDNTDTHLTEAEVDAMADNNGYLTSFTEVDGDITNEIQDLQLVGNDLTITNNGTATSIDLTPYLDDTDTHLTEGEVDAMTENNGYLTSFTEVDGDITNEIQDISLSGTNLSITDGSTIDLSTLQDGTGTDEQTLSISDNDLSISNGNTIDLSSILEPLEIAMDDLIHRIDSLENVITDCCGGAKIETDNANIDEAILYQNIPNPWGETTTINYYLPYTTNNARIEIRTAEGKIVSTINIAAKGDGHIIISAGAYAEGIYFYTLIANNKLVDTKRFVLAY